MLSILHTYSIQGRTPLHYAVERRSLTMIKLLLQQGTIDLDAKDNLQEQTALYQLVSSKKYLQTCSRFEQIQDANGEEAREAAEALEVLSLMLEHCDVNALSGPDQVGSMTSLSKC